MGPNPHRSARSPEQFRRWVRLSVATVTSTALVGGVLVAVPAHPLNPITGVAAAQIAEDQQAIANGNVLGVQLAGGELIGVGSASQSWPDNSAENPTTSNTDVSLGDLATLTIPELGIPVVGGENDGLLQVGGGLGVVGSSAHTPNANEAEALSGVVGTDGSIDLDATRNSDEIVTSLQLTGPLEQLGLSAITDVVVDDVSLDLGVAGSRATSVNGVTSSEYAVSEANLTLGVPLLSGILGSLGDIVDGLANLPLLDVLLGLLGLDNLTQLLDPIYDGATPEESLAVIDLREGIITLQLDQIHDEGLNGLGPNESLLSRGLTPVWWTR